MAVETLDLSNDGSGMVSIQPEKNVPQEQEQEQEMDVTPIEEIMTTQEVEVPQQLMVPQAPPPMPQAMPMPQAPPMPEKRTIANLTPEQTEALFVGLVAIIAFSDPVQKKLLQVIPQMVNETGSRTLLGMGVTGLIAAVLYVVGRRVLNL